MNHIPAADAHPIPIQHYMLIGIGYLLVVKNVKQ